MPDKYKNPANAIKAYRDFYIGEKARFAKWTLPAQPPDWWYSSL
jgi:hypothetical protein